MPPETVDAGIFPSLMLGRLCSLLQTPLTRRIGRESHAFLSVSLCILLCVCSLTQSTRAQFAETEIRLLQYGVGNVARMGDPVGLLVEVRNSLDAPTEVELVWETRNADGDLEENARKFVLNPGQPIERWIYGTTPEADSATDATSAVTTLRVFSLTGGRRQRELATLPISAETAETTGSIVSHTVGIFGVMGPQSLGLSGYATNYNSQRSPAQNTNSIIARVGSVEGLPDRWYGLAALDALVWTDGSAAPARLSTDQSDALLEWIERGGQLVIALNANGDPWDLGGNGRHALQPLLPSVAPMRMDAVNMQDVLPVLSLSRQNNAPNASTRVAIFDKDALDRQWEPVLAFPSKKTAAGFAAPREGSLDAKIYAVERSYGYGTITLVGLDLFEISARRLQSDTSLPQCDVFWNRILGRRGDTPSAGELKALEDAKRLAKGGVSSDLEGGGLVAGRIGLLGSAAISILAATGTFSIYWLLAGPVGFAILKSMKRERWAWVYSAMLSLAFAIAIWFVGSALSGSTAQVKYLMFLDAAARPQGEVSLLQRQPIRASGWLSVHVPEYASSELNIGAPEDGRTMVRTWLNPSDPTIEGFPSQARVHRSLDEDHTLAMVSRAASTDFSFRWLGGIDPNWGELPSIVSPVRVDIDRTKSPIEVKLVGTLVHQLPGTLRNVMLVHIWPLRAPVLGLRAGKLPLRTPSGAMPNLGTSVILPEWKPNSPLDLAKAFGTKMELNQSSLEAQFDFRFYDSVRNLASPFNSFRPLKVSQAEEERFLQMLSFYNMLQPPKYTHAVDAESKFLAVERLIARDADLSKWCTRPCLIVYGLLEGGGSPVPLRVDGEDVDSTGEVVLRWILPLPSSTDAHDIVPSLGTTASVVSPVEEARPSEVDPV